MSKIKKQLYSQFQIVIILNHGCGTELIKYDTKFDASVIAVSVANFRCPESLN